MNWPKLPKNDWRSTWVKLGSGAIGLRIVFGLFPSFCEMVYSRGVYPYIRSFLDMTFGKLPFAGVYIFALILLFLVPKFIFSFVRNILKKESLKQQAFSFSAFILGLIFWFMTLWGFNYARVPLAQQIHINPPEFLGYQDIWAEAQYIKKSCIEQRNKIPNLDTFAITAAYYPKDLETEMRYLLEEILKDLGYDVSGQVSGRQLLPQGILLHFSSSGLYFPFTGEGHIDAALPAVVKPFTMAHELAHGYGFGNEAVCNFLGYLACQRSDNPAIKYAGSLTYWRYVYGELMGFMTEEDYQKERATISRGMYQDVEGIYTTLDNYLPWIPGIQQTAYDMYLKAQGIEEGIESYNQMVLLVATWRKQKK